MANTVSEHSKSQNIQINKRFQLSSYQGLENVVNRTHLLNSQSQISKILQFISYKSSKMLIKQNNYHCYDFTVTVHR